MPSPAAVSIAGFDFCGRRHDLNRQAKLGQLRLDNLAVADHDERQAVRLQPALRSAVQRRSVNCPIACGQRGVIVVRPA